MAWLPYSCREMSKHLCHQTERHQTKLAHFSLVPFNLSLETFDKTTTMDVMPEEEELRMEQHIHLIPDDDDDKQSTCSERQETFVCPHSSARGHFEGTMPSYEEALEGFAQVGLLAREIGSSVIKREAALVNQRLIDVQDRMHSQKRRKLESDAHVATKSLSSNLFVHERHRPVSVEEQESIAYQAGRMKRMSLLLMNLETTHQLLLEEMIACASDLDVADDS